MCGTVIIMKLSQELEARGLIYQHSGDLTTILDGKKRTVYLGIDPTADAIHVGNLVAYMLLNHLLRGGHKVILLMGGATALIGDPSGRDTEREFVDAKIVAARAKKMEKNIRQITGRASITFVNNYDWLKKLSMIEFLRDVGKHFTVNAMVKKESVSKRLLSESGISFTEFSYSLLQSYDYYYLNQKYGCDLQIGGSDQWGNITAGIDYVRRTNGKEVYGVTLPLVVDKATGKKFGKSMGNAVWLDAEKTTPYALYQFWLNVADESAVTYLKMFTLLSLEEIAGIEKEFEANRGSRSAQKRLAFEVVKMVHGESEARKAEKVSDALFSGVGIEALSLDEQKILVQNAPSYQVPRGQKIVEVLVSSGLAQSNREARQFIEEGAVTLGEEKVSDAQKEIHISSPVLLRRGKKSVMVLIP